MAQCKATPYEFVQNAFSPLVAVLSSPFAEQISRKNNLSFIEMVQPFCRLTSEVHFRDPLGANVAVKNLRVCLQDVHSRPPQPTLARKFLNDSASNAINDNTTTLTFGDQKIEVPSSTPWFEAWRETFLQVQFPADHEFTKHYLGCIAVVSSAEPSPVDAMRGLRQQIQSLQAVAPGKLPKWMATPSPPLVYHLLLHDVNEGDTAKAESSFNAMKSEYGVNNCFLLNINSRPLGQHEDTSHIPDPWSQFLSRLSDTTENHEYDNSPRTPAEISGVTGMPNRVSTDDTEVAQEASQELPSDHMVESGASSPVPVMQHPLSPQEDGYLLPGTENGGAVNHMIGNAPLNTNVWAGVASSATPVTTPMGNNHLLPHGACLTTPDLDRIRAFIHDMCAHALLPHVEKQIQQLHDQISNKKSVSRSLLGATKRWFGTNKPGAPNSSVPTNAVIYSGDAPELQLRRMGDLCFMFRHYKFAYEAYHIAKRDFAADGAWLYYAGALEMAALSIFMMGEGGRKAQEYCEEAIITYLNTCRLQQFATRSTLLSTECLKSRAQYGDAAKQLLRMTSEDSDLRSALLLEQAAFCYLQASKPPMLRKFSFHMVLAGHRFNKAGQKKHSLRCYQQAYQIYKDKGWNLAEDHIHFTIGRQAAYLRMTELSAEAFGRLFNPASKQSPPQQAAFLREYLQIYQQIPSEAGVLPSLPIPLLKNSSIAVLVGPLPPPADKQHGPLIFASRINFVDDAPDEASSWAQLEEKLLTDAQGSAQLIFKPVAALFTNHTDNSKSPISVLGEPVSVSVIVQNPTGVPLPLSNVHLLWAFKVSNDTITPNAKDEIWIENEKLQGKGGDVVETCVMSQLLLEPNSTRQLVLSVTPHQRGELRLLGIAYRLNYPSSSSESIPIPNPTPGVPAPSALTPMSPTSSNLSVLGKQMFVLAPKKLLRVGKERPTQDKVLEDNRLNVVIVAGAPQLQVKMAGLVSEMLCGEMQKVQIELSNIGSIPIQTLLVGSTTPHIFSIADLPPIENGPKGLPQVQRIPLQGPLKPQQQLSLTMWLRAPDSPGPAALKMLFYLDSGNNSSLPKYRLVRHYWPITVLESVQFSAEASRSQALNAQEMLNINTRITNTNKVQDLLLTKVSLLQVSLASRLWVLGNLPINLPQQDTVLSSQESVQFLLRASRCSQGDDTTFSDKALSMAMTEPVEPCANRPYRDFLQRIPDWGSSSANSADKSSVTEAALTINVTLVLKWKAAVMDSGGAVRSAFGQTHLTLTRLNKRVACPPLTQSSVEKGSVVLRVFGPDRNVPSESDIIASKGALSLETMQQLVTYSLKHPAHISHDFNRQRLCIVDVQLILHNCCDSSIVAKVSLANLPSGMPSKSQLYLPHASSVVRWVGRLVSNVELAARSAQTLSLRAAIPGPGTYNLGAHLQVFCWLMGASDKEAVLQRMRLESAIVISESLVGSSNCSLVSDPAVVMASS
ncbi:hypothetical protein ONE63_010723 [Megalurothrips usitatus]|uniref:Trafficking protein particle complex subunit 8 n=1 Tax=Megalurothrips usitatus TaxID=439358 RepID=A0AAV7XDW5_9NEOP|nr:hypothetical protein ONE63_010723 [Megalurothrips usitatus]